MSRHVAPLVSNTAVTRPETLLVVCTGNICRSPLIELDLTARLVNRSPVRTISRGTAAVSGRGMPREMVEIARRHDLDASAHAARQLTRGDVLTASLVLTATRAQRVAVINLTPRASRYTFTLKEFARLVHDQREDGTVQTKGCDTASLHAAAAHAHAHRGPSRPADPAHDDVADPFRQSRAVYELSAREIFDATTSIAQVLCPS